MEGRQKWKFAYLSAITHHYASRIHELKMVLVGANCQFTKTLGVNGL